MEPRETALKETDLTETDLKEKVAVVTGGAGGIGLGLARACLDEGMRVMISDLDAGRLAATADALRGDGGTVVDHACDVRAVEEVEALRDATLQAFGQIDLVCNNAGVGLAKPVLDTTDTDWSLLIDVNLWGVVHGIRTFLPTMVDQGHGHLSATSSLSGLVGDPDLVVYNGTKFAVAGIMEGLALELHRDHPGVSCSVLCPGPVATDLMVTSNKQLADSGSPPADTSEIAEYLAAGMAPDDVGRFAIDGIKAGRFWLLTHPDYTMTIMEPRFEAMRHGQLHVPDDWVGTRD